MGVRSSPPVPHMSRWWKGRHKGSMEELVDSPISNVGALTGVQMQILLLLKEVALGCPNW